MKTLFLVIVCFFTTLSQAQTAIIAHKSHSGSTADFFIDPSTNFGIASPQLVQVIRINDSTSIEVYDTYRGYYEYDTVYKNPTYANYNLDLDSIAQSPYHRKVEYLNFKKSSKSLKPKPPRNQIHQIEKIQPDKLQEVPQQEATPRKKKRSALLFIFLITGGGLILFRFIGHLFTPQIAS